MTGTLSNASALLLALMLSGAGAHAASRGMPTLPEATPDGRFGTACRLWGGGTNETLCVVPFVRLLAAPERFQKKLIEVTGILGSEEGRPTLYATRESYSADAPLEGLRIDGDLSSDIAGQLHRGVCVTVVGVFDGTYFGHGGNNLGILRDVRNIAQCRPPHDSP